MSDVSKTPLLRRDDGEMLAYHFTPGRQPGVVFMAGYMSDMTGGKALCLEEFCQVRGTAYLRFDYFGHGASTGAFTDGTIGRWADDAVFALDRLTQGPQVLVGSSLGGWIMVLAALKRRNRIAGLLGIASAPDFTEDLIPLSLSDAQKEIIERDGVVPVASPYDPEPTPVTKLILDEARAHLVLRDEIPLDCPVRLIHGLDDPDVPWQTSLKLAQRLRSDDVELSLIKAGGHRMSEPDDLERLCTTLERLLCSIEATA